jgi:phosphatidylserine decarboxylase
MKRLLKENKLPVQIEGLLYIFIGLILTALSALIGNSAVLNVASFFFALFTAFSAWFFRNPKRTTPTDDPLAVYSPADGRVLSVIDVDGSRIGAPKAKKISIFMSPMDVHVNRAPIAGQIENIEYVKGKFFAANIDKASEENEHNWVQMKTEAGIKIAFVQIAGFIARRIICYVELGERLKAGERYGMIQFGSRMEILVPSDSRVMVKKDEHVTAGITVLAKLKSN